MIDMTDRDPLETLCELQRTVAHAINSYHPDTSRKWITDQDRIKNLKCYGPHDFIIGEFAITRISDLRKEQANIIGSECVGITDDCTLTNQVVPNDPPKPS